MTYLQNLVIPLIESEVQIQIFRAMWFRFVDEQTLTKILFKYLSAYQEILHLNG